MTAHGVMFNKARTVKTAALAIAGLLFLLPCTAGAVTSATSLTCNQLRAMINQGTPVLLYVQKENKVLRFVNSTVQCPSMRSLAYTSVRTKDKRYCTVRQCANDMLHDRNRYYWHDHHGHHRW